MLLVFPLTARTRSSARTSSTRPRCSGSPASATWSPGNVDLARDGLAPARLDPGRPDRQPLDASAPRAGRCASRSRRRSRSPGSSCSRCRAPRLHPGHARLVGVGVLWSWARSRQSAAAAGAGGSGHATKGLPVSRQPSLYASQPVQKPVAAASSASAATSEPSAAPSDRQRRPRRRSSSRRSGRPRRRCSRSGAGASPRAGPRRSAAGRARSRRGTAGTSAGRTSRPTSELRARAARAATTSR